MWNKKWICPHIRCISPPLNYFSNVNEKVDTEFINFDRNYKTCKQLQTALLWRKRLHSQASAEQTKHPSSVQDALQCPQVLSHVRQPRAGLTSLNTSARHFRPAKIIHSIGLQFWFRAQEGELCPDIHLDRVFTLLPVGRSFTRNRSSEPAPIVLNSNLCSVY